MLTVHTNEVMRWISLKLMRFNRNGLFSTIEHNPDKPRLLSIDLAIILTQFPHV